MNVHWADLPQHTKVWLSHPKAYHIAVPRNIGTSTARWLLCKTISSSSNKVEQIIVFLYYNLSSV